MPGSYKRKNSMKKSKSSKSSKRVKTTKNTKTKKRLTRKSKNESVVRKMRGGSSNNILPSRQKRLKKEFKFMSDNSFVFDDVLIEKDIKNNKTEFVFKYIKGDNNFDIKLRIPENYPFYSPEIFIKNDVTEYSKIEVPMKPKDKLYEVISSQISKKIKQKKHENIKAPPVNSHINNPLTTNTKSDDTNHCQTFFLQEKKEKMVKKKILILCHPKIVSINDKGELQNHFYGDTNLNIFNRLLPHFTLNKDDVIETVDIKQGGTYKDDVFANGVNAFTSTHMNEYDLVLLPDCEGKWMTEDDEQNFVIMCMNLTNMVKQYGFIIFGKLVKMETNFYVSLIDKLKENTQFNVCDTSIVESIGRVIIAQKNLI